MALEIPRLLEEYAKAVALLSADYALGLSTSKSKVHCALDQIDPIKLALNPTPEILKKAGILQTMVHPLEKISYLEEFTVSLNIESDRIIKHLSGIAINYTTEFIEIIKELSATIESIIRNLIALASIIIWFTLMFVLQIVYTLLVDVFQTMLNLVLMFMWFIYAFLFMTPDVVAGADQRAPENADYILAVLIPFQIFILMLYLAYIFIMISLYVANFITSLVLIVVQVVSIIIRRAMEVALLVNQSMEQVTGAAGIIPLIVSVTAARSAGTALLMAQMVNPMA